MKSLMSLRGIDRLIGLVALALVPTAQPMRVMGSELVAPEADQFVGDEDASPGQQILDVPVA